MIVAFLLVSIPFVIAVAVAFLTVHGRTAGGGGMLGAPLDAEGDPLLLSISVRNSLAALTLFAGVVTLGTVSMIGMTLLGFLVGASTAAAITEVGVTAALTSVFGYAVIEIPSFLLAGMSGVLPLATAITGSRLTLRMSIVSRYTSSIRDALTLLFVSLALILVGAVVETLMITGRSI